MTTLSQDLLLICFLAFLEGILSLDNALVLAMMARGLPIPQQRKALTYGLMGSIAFRLIALSLATRLMHWHWIKLAGGLYLVYVALAHLLRGKKDARNHRAARGFWRTVLMIEIMDIAFAVDSILAAVALTPKFWIVFIGGMIGVVLMRFAAGFFLKLLKKFPSFESAAYLLVLIIGVKLGIDWLRLPGVEFEHPGNAAFWVFWGSMGICALSGFRPARKNHADT